MEGLRLGADAIDAVLARRAPTKERPSLRRLRVVRDLVGLLVRRLERLADDRPSDTATWFVPAPLWNGGVDRGNTTGMCRILAAVGSTLGLVRAPMPKLFMNSK
jgi:hypothetical protein